ncbi:hypothetical protein KJR81_11685 [Klebsiella pneumoniae]
MFSEERTSWEREMLIREAIENAEQGFTVHLRNGARITVSSNSPSIDLIIYGLEKTIRGNHERARMTFIDYLYFWHERLFKLAKR